MAGRILFIENRCKLAFSNNYLIVETSGEENRYFLEDIEAVVLASMEISVSLYLLDKLASAGKTVVLCDGRKFPCSGLLPLYGVQNAFAHIKEQIAWKKDLADCVWRQIVLNKIRCQQEVLAANGLPNSFREDVLPGDAGNAEGRFADFYFHYLFGRSFRRHLSDDWNIALNYGYTILSSAMARIIAGHGYVPALGIHHCGETNNINLACDCIEPFRPVIDRIVLERGCRLLDKEYKSALILSLNQKIMYRGSLCAVRYAMERYFCEIAGSMQKGVIDIGEIGLN